MFDTDTPHYSDQYLNLSPLVQGDGLLRVNGDIGSAPTSPESQGRESPPQFQASPSVTVNSSVDAPSSAAVTTHSPPASTAGENLVSTTTTTTAVGKEAPHVPETVAKEAREEKVVEHSSPSRPTSLPSVRVAVFVDISVCY